MLINFHHHGSSKLNIERQFAISSAVCKLAANPLNYATCFPTWSTHIGGYNSHYCRRRLHTGPPGHRLHHCSDDFPIVVENSYSDDNVKSLLDRLGSHSHATRLATYKMEAFLQSSVSIPNWSVPTFILLNQSITHLCRTQAKGRTPG